MIINQSSMYFFKKNIWLIVCTFPPFSFIHTGMGGQLKNNPVFMVDSGQDHENLVAFTAFESNFGNKKIQCQRHYTQFMRYHQCYQLVTKRVWFTVGWKTR